MTQRAVLALLIGSTQLIGQYLGSTTLWGAVIYAVVTVAWWGWMLRYREWGFITLNAGGALISGWNLWAVIR